VPETEIEPRKLPEAFEGLTILQQRFAEILFTMPEPNQALAYREAGYRSGTKATDDANACRLAKSDKVKAYIDYLRANSVKKTQKTVADAIKELADIGFKASDGNPTYKNRIAALTELLNRWQGRPKQQVEVKAVILKRELTDAEVKALMEDEVLPKAETNQAIAT